MANNLNQKFPRYVESDLNKANVVKPPRIRSKEVDIYIYETNKTILEVIQNDSALAIQAKFSQTIKFQSTVPLNGDIAKPKFADPSDSAIWGGQINGIIYDELDLDSSNYNFFTLGLVNQDQLATAVKYRITSYEPVYDNKNKFLYANLIAIQDSIKTIKSIQKLNWNLVQAFQADVKTKYLKIEFDYKTNLYANGFSISILAEKNERARDVGFTINSASSDITIKFIKIRQTNPLLIDDLSLSEVITGLPDSMPNTNPISLSAERTIIERTYFPPDADSISRAEVSKEKARIIVASKSNPNSATEISVSKGSGYNPAERYFSYPWNVNLSRGFIEQRILTNRDISNFLSGSFSIDGFPVNTKDPFEITNVIKRIIPERVNFQGSDRLDVDNEIDRLYFVLTKKMDLTKVFAAQNQSISNPSTASGIQYDSRISKIGTPLKSRLITESEWNNNSLNEDDFTIELELQQPGYNPKFDYEASNGSFFKITQYDENHNIIGIPQLRFQTENVFNDAKKKGSIQL